MKCGACKYEYEYDYSLRETIKGNHKFIDLESGIIEIENKYFDGWHGDRMKRTSLCACPKCGTIRIYEIMPMDEDDEE